MSGMIRILSSTLAVVLIGVALTTTPTAGAVEVRVSASAAARVVLKVKIRAPKGVPATVLVAGRRTRLTVAKPPSGRHVTEKLAVRAGRLSVKAQGIAWDGKVYAPTKSEQRVQVSKGRVATAVVRYVRVRSAATALAISGMTQTSVRVRWKATRSTTSVRLVARSGTTGARTVRDGRVVKVKPNSSRATVKGLAAGQPVSLSLFSKTPSGWSAPLQVTAATAPEAGTLDAQFIAAPNSRLFKAGEVRGVEGVPDGLEVQISGDPLQIGAPVVVPNLPELPGGFVGRVVALNEDGTALLEQAAISHAFPLFIAKVPSIGRAITAAPASRTARDGAPRMFKRGSGASLATPSPSPFTCTGAETHEGQPVSVAATITPAADVDGYMDFAINTIGPDWLKAPTGARFAGNFFYDVAASLDVEASVTAECKLTEEPELAGSFAIGPVPFAVSVAFSPSIAISGSLKATGYHLFQTSKTTEWDYGVGDQPSLTIPALSTTETPAVPVAWEGSGTVAATAAITVQVGPGINVPRAEVTAGLSIEPALTAAGSLTASSGGVCFAATLVGELPAPELGVEAVIEDAPDWLNWQASIALPLPGMVDGRYSWEILRKDAPEGCSVTPTPTPTPTPPPTPTPTPPPTPPGQVTWSSLTAGYDHSCGVKTDGTAWCWGNNDDGQFGNGTTTARLTPTQVPGSWSSLTAGYDHACGIKTDGTAWCWGSNSAGQLGDGTTTPRLTPTQVPGSWSDVTVGSFHSCGIQTDGSAWCWGDNYYGSVGDGTTTVRVVPTQVPGSWTSLTTGYSHSCGVKADGTAWCWGYNHDGQLGNGATQDESPSPTQVPGTWTSITAGGLHTCGIGAAGTASCWGDNDFGQLGDGTNTDRSTPTQVPGSWSSLARGSSHSCGVKLDGSAWCWGYNFTGQLGDGTTTDRTTPTPVSGA